MTFNKYIVAKIVWEWDIYFGGHLRVHQSLTFLRNRSGEKCFEKRNWSNLIEIEIEEDLDSLAGLFEYNP